MASAADIQKQVAEEWVTDFLTTDERKSMLADQTEFMVTSVRYAQLDDQDGRKDAAGNLIQHDVIYYGIVFTVPGTGVVKRTVTLSDNDYRHLQSVKIEAAIVASPPSCGPWVFKQGPSNKRFNNPRWELAAPGSEAPDSDNGDIDPDDIPF